MKGLLICIVAILALLVCVSYVVLVSNPVVGIIDRFEGQYAVVELSTRQMVDVPRIIVPKDAKEGSTIKVVLGR
jgi:hypothetical protein